MKFKSKTLILISFLLFGLFISLSSVSAATKTLYSWAKDATGNISTSLSDSIDITLPEEPTNTFYVSYSTGLDTNNGTSPSTPWKTIAHVNSQTLQPGDSILFKKGDTWTGETITVNSSGNSTSPITYSSYGTGAQPVISGFTTVTGWTNEGNGIYSKVISPQSAPEMVTINDVQYGMGRWPNAGTWATVDSHSTNVSITDSILNSSVINWTGARIVQRKPDGYNINRNTITNHSGQTLTYSNGTTEPSNGYGYFVQNDIRTLDQMGEWYYNSSTGKFSMYFGGVNPVTKVVKASTVDSFIVYPMWTHYITVDGISFTGSNNDSITSENGYGSTYITIQNCSITFSGGSGILMISTQHTNINNNIVSNVNDYGIFVAGWYAHYAYVGYNNISYTGLILGHGGTSLWDQGSGIYVGSADHVLIEYNNLYDIGFDGITFGGGAKGPEGGDTDMIVTHNYINGFCSQKEDGGAIYTANDINATISYNIAINGGSYTGHTSGGTLSSTMAAAGIYVDYGINQNLVINNNIMANLDWGALTLHGAQNIDIYDNTFYNGGPEIGRFQESPGTFPPFNINMSGNIFLAKNLSQVAWWIRTEENYFNIGNLSNNYYIKPIDSNNLIKAMYGVWDSTPITLAQWQTLSGQDLNSHTSPVAITDPNNILFEYNATTSNKVVSLGSNTYVDVTGATKTGSITLLPYTSIVLIKTN